MFSKLMEKQLLFSMRLDKSSYGLLHLFGKLAGILPVWYSRRIEKKYECKDFPDNLYRDAPGWQESEKDAGGDD